MSEFATPEAPDPNDQKNTRQTMATALWRDGWKHGHSAGYVVGHANGRSVMNSWWTVCAVVVWFVMGIGVGYGADWVRTCVPIAASDVKSCTTSYGDGR